MGTSFLRVAAHDDDFGTNAAITYSMSLDQPEYLRVNPVTGWVYVNQPISQVRQWADSYYQPLCQPHMSAHTHPDMLYDMTSLRVRKVNELSTLKCIFLTPSARSASSPRGAE